MTPLKSQYVRLSSNFSPIIQILPSFNKFFLSFFALFRHKFQKILRILKKSSGGNLLLIIRLFFRTQCGSICHETLLELALAILSCYGLT